MKFTTLPDFGSYYNEFKKAHRIESPTGNILRSHGNRIQCLQKKIRDKLTKIGEYPADWEVGNNWDERLYIGVLINSAKALTADFIRLCISTIAEEPDFPNWTLSFDVSLLGSDPKFVGQEGSFFVRKNKLHISEGDKWILSNLTELVGDSSAGAPSSQ